MIVWDVGGAAWILLVFLAIGLCRAAGAPGCDEPPATTGHSAGGRSAR